VKVTRKIMLTVGALMLPAAFVLTIGTTTAGAAKSATTSPGPITCKGVKGTITFTPPLVSGGTATETSTIVSVTVTKCKNAPHVTGTVPKKGTVSVNIASGTGTDNCTSLSGNTVSPESLTVTWTSPAGLGTSTSAYSGYDGGVVSGGKDGFKLPNTNSGTGSTTGTFAEASGSTAAVYSNKTSAQLAAECSGGGISTLDLAKGSTTL